MIITNAKIYSMDKKGVIENGFVAFDDVRISVVGSMDALPETGGHTVLDAGGKMLFPGFVDAHSHLGMWEDSLAFEGDDGNEETDPSTPQLRAVDAVNPFDRSFKEALSAGVTTVVTGPGSANPVGGQMAALKTFGRYTDEMVIASPAAVKFALGENPKKIYAEKNQTPSTRMATAAIIREQLLRAGKYLEDLNDNRSDHTPPPEYDIKNESLLPLLKGEIPAHFHAHRLDDIFTAVRIAREFSLRFAIVHATGAHKAAGLIAEQGIDVMCGPLICDRSKPELAELSLSAPAILSQAGVRLCIITDHPAVPQQYLALCAALAVSEGMDAYAALEAITINPAEICGIGHRVGSLAKGKDADFCLFDKWPLGLNVKPVSVFCGGVQVI